MFLFIIVIFLSLRMLEYSKKVIAYYVIISAIYVLFKEAQYALIFIAFYSLKIFFYFLIHL